MKIKLKSEWMGHPEGSVIAVAQTMGYRLEHSGIAEIIDARPFNAPAPKPLEMMSYDEGREDEREEVGEENESEQGAEPVEAGEGSEAETKEDAETDEGQDDPVISE